MGEVCTLVLFILQVCILLYTEVCAPHLLCLTGGRRGAAQVPASQRTAACTSTEGRERGWGGAHSDHVMLMAGDSSTQ